MKAKKIKVKIYSIPNCPACDMLKDMMKALISDNKDLRDYIDSLEIIDNYKGDEHKEFPVFQILDLEDTLLFECIGCYTRSTVLWKMINWINRG